MNISVVKGERESERYRGKRETANGVKKQTSES